jgi:hypothetical protein
LYAKASKCEFDMKNILYLGHVMSAQGVKVHQERIQAILDWPTPRTLIELHGLFGICNYYKRFVKVFSQLEEPLIDLMKKGEFR